MSILSQRAPGSTEPSTRTGRLLHPVQILAFALKTLDPMQSVLRSVWLLSLRFYADSNPLLLRQAVGRIVERCGRDEVLLGVLRALPCTYSIILSVTILAVLIARYPFAAAARSLL